ncbi:MAG: putative iron-sulfur cluster-binding metallochaperone [Anaerolineales bacterium]
MNAAPLSVACPTNGQTGKPVDSLTLKALVAIPLTRLTSNAYRFCRASDCLTVYYSPDGAHCFGEAELRERVYQKHPADDDMFVCYCFRHTVGDVRAALVEQRAGAILDAINAGIQAGQCACDIRNPQGSCCLGNVRALIQRLIAAPDAPAV